MAQVDSESRLDGILVVDKSLGITSMTAVTMVRRKAGGVRTGHAGTLDPLATGVLVMALGSATKCIDQLMATTKRYRTVIDLSAFTTTDDAEGERTEVDTKTVPLAATVRESIAKFVGRIQQRPPAFSAVKIDGERAYKLARKGDVVEPKAREVVIHSIDLVRYDWPLVELEMHCDKGVYVRSLARDLGVALGTGGFCSMIRRTAVGPFSVDEARSIDGLPEKLTPADLMSVDEALGRIGTGA
jgi:tRNA pseudouridine55 synthase